MDSVKPIKEQKMENISIRTKVNVECVKKVTPKMATDQQQNNNKKTEMHGATTETSSKIAPGPSPFRNLLPYTLFLLSFFTVMSLLVFYMDPSEFRQKQFRLNMARDYDLLGVQQEDPSLVAYIREVHLKKYAAMTSNLLAHAGPPEHLNISSHHELTPEMAAYMVKLLGDKKGGIFMQSLSGSSGAMLTAPWLATLGWTGFIVEPDPRKYFALRKENARREGVEVIHACLSPSGHPKEVTLQHEVGINSILEQETDEAEGFHSRVKCFPLYSLLLAVNHTTLDVMSLGCQGQELEVLQTIPFNKLKVQVISIHLSQHFDEHEDEQEEYMRRVHKFLFGRSFKLKRRFQNNYIYQTMYSKRDPLQL